MITRRINLRGIEGEALVRALRHEWLITNGLGGYASGTIAGSPLWRYHGLFVAALPAPLGRMMMLNHLGEELLVPTGKGGDGVKGGALSGESSLPAKRIQIGGMEPEVSASIALAEFRLENRVPVWIYEINGVQLRKELLFLHGQNTVHVTYRLLKGDSATLHLQPSFAFRPHEHAVNSADTNNYKLTVEGERFEILSPGNPVLRMSVEGSSWRFECQAGCVAEVRYPREADRGYPARGPLWSPGAFHIALQPGASATLVVSTESWTTLTALSPAEALQFHHDRNDRLVRIAAPAARLSPAADLVLAADQFIIEPAGRIQDMARAHAAGDEVRTVIAGYHWFTDWGRDTMISLEGLTLTTRRYTEAGWILRTFAHYMREGLIPNLFPEGRNQGLYHTADATLWFFHALSRYMEHTHDGETLSLILPKLVNSMEAHLRGTLFGIGVDPADGLLRQGAPGYQLTWMDAKVEDWVVTPRRGKAVEINALYYNALRLLEQWLSETGKADLSRTWAAHAERVRDSFNAKFWYESGQHLFDVIEGEQGNAPACRPNQLLSFSLDYPVLERSRWKPVLDVVEQRLLTPVGLRTLSRDHPDYKSRYFGDLRARDAAYHQGTVWAWLIGPYVDAWLKVYPGEFARARELLSGIAAHLDDACLGSVSEIFDAEPPYTPRGCVAQAWSVAESLRCWVKTAGKATG